MSIKSNESVSSSNGQRNYLRCRQSNPSLQSLPPSIHKHHQQPNPPTAIPSFTVTQGSRSHTNASNNKPAHPVSPLLCMAVWFDETYSMQLGHKAGSFQSRAFSACSWEFPDWGSFVRLVRAETLSNVPTVAANQKPYPYDIAILTEPGIYQGSLRRLMARVSKSEPIGRAPSTEAREAPSYTSILLLNTKYLFDLDV